MAQAHCLGRVLCLGEVNTDPSVTGRQISVTAVAPGRAMRYNKARKQFIKTTHLKMTKKISLLAVFSATITILSGVCVWADTYYDPITGYELQLMVAASSPVPPPGFERQIADIGMLSESAYMLSGVPTSSWTYGCSATSAGMIFGYYDRDPRDWYPNMYTGPANGGVAPLTDLGNPWSIIATQNGFDGWTTYGHVDDYWISYLSEGPDPWEGNWTEHTWAECTADFMGTNQWKWDFDPPPGQPDANIDGSTVWWSYDSGDKLYDYIQPASSGLPQTAGCHGMRLFAESRGYMVAENYTQNIDTLYAGGFSFADYMWEIDNGYPVMIHVTGHTMVGVGYDAPTETVYLHDTWGDYVASMTWGGAYSGMDHYSMTVIHLAAIPEPTTIALFGLGLLGLGAKLRRRKQS